MKHKNQPLNKLKHQPLNKVLIYINTLAFGAIVVLLVYLAITSDERAKQR